MPFDLAALKGKIDDATLTALTEHVTGLASKADEAQAALRAAKAAAAAKAQALQAERDAAFGRLGVASAEELAALPDAKGQAEASAQAAARIKSLERQLREATARGEELGGKLRQERTSAAVAKALGGVDWIDAADAQVMIERGLHHDGDDVLYKLPDGKLIPLGDAAATLAKTKPHLVKAAGAQAQGSGWRGNGGGNPAPEKPNMLTATPKELAEWQRAQAAAAQ